MTQNSAHNVLMNMGDSNAILKGIFSHMIALSPTEPNALHQNNQKQILAEFPTLSNLEGEPITNLYPSFNISNHVALLNSNASVPRNTQFERNTVSYPLCPISNTHVATLLAERSPHHDNPKELGTFVSNDYCDALNSAYASSLNYGFDGIASAMNSKWDSDNFQSFQLGNINPDLWISSENSNASLDKPLGSSRFSNELSLSLASDQPSFIHGTRNSGVTCHSLNEKDVGSDSFCNSKNRSLTFGSFRPVQIPQFESGSTFLRVIQEILAEIASYSLENLVQVNYPTNGTMDVAKIPLSSSRNAERSYMVVVSDDFPNGDARFVVQKDFVIQRQVFEAKEKKLLALLQLVDDQYNQCVNEIHSLIYAFHAATELDPHIHARFALQTISSLYKSLRGRISSQILRMGEFLSKGDITREKDKSFQPSFIQKQWALQHQLQRKDHQFWRPQRGLPERSVSVLRAWMFQNFLHPYPKDAEKQLLAVRSGLTRSQVSNWFINARVRLWKPMIEEMYTEMNRRKDRRNDKETESNHGRHLDITSRILT